MRIVFMGTPEFGVLTLLEMSKSGSVPVAVYTGAPAQSGRRGLEIRKTPVHSTADSLGIPVLMPTSLRRVETQKQLKNDASIFTPHCYRVGEALPRSNGQSWRATENGG
jgi:methionyl-tRNA formyltransferase